MSNLQKIYEEGQEGRNLGLSTGLEPLDEAINRVQRKNSIGLAAAPKCGKTTLADYCFLLSPYLQMEREGRLDDIEWIYWSLEIDRISKEFKFASFFMNYDYGVSNFMYKDKLYLMSNNYLMGKLVHKNPDKSQELIRMTKEHEEMLINIYRKRIIPIFGRYDRYGQRTQMGKVDIIEEAENPTGMYKYARAFYSKRGKWETNKYETMDDNQKLVTKTKEVGYTPNNPRLYSILITDHIRKPTKERDFTPKQNIDKWLEYSSILRNRCMATPINICHSNRGISNVERLRFHGEMVFPTADDVKDTGNLAEESTILMTLFHAGDEKYNLTRHMGVELSENPNYRSLHITESRDTDSPVHIQTNMTGNINLFTPL